MNIQDCLTHFDKEKKTGIPSRFPCRVILVNNRNKFSQLILGLEGLCDHVISADDLFNGKDTMPQYERVCELLETDKWLLLLGVNEYLRLFNKSEIVSNNFGKLWHKMVDSTNRGRVIIPLWNCDALFYDSALKFCSDPRQEDFIYTIDENADENETMSVTVFSNIFSSYQDQLNDKYHPINGLRSWYEWINSQKGIPENYSLITRHYKTVDPTVGTIKIKVIKDTFSFLCENLSDGAKLKTENLSDELINELFPSALKGYSINEGILSIFNLKIFDGQSMMSKWNLLGTGQKQLIQLWYRLNPDNTYLCHCFNSSDLSNIENSILLDIFDSQNRHPEWVEEAQMLHKLLKLKKNEAFFEKLDTILINEDKLAYLSTETQSERVYILRMVGKWFKQDIAQVRSSESLEKLYPSLFAYLKADSANIENQFREYITRYKQFKLSNTLPEDEEMYRNGLDPDVLPYRYSLLSQKIESDTVILWIDALGYEYLSLLNWVLSNKSNGKVVYAGIAQATLPTETDFNNQWEQMDVPCEKRDKLDKLAHKGVIDDPDYYSCVEEQLSFVVYIGEIVDDLLKKYHRVIITGDHGTSRLAARFFHERDGITKFKDSVVLSHGRYCKVKDKPTIMNDSMKYVKTAQDNQYVVLKTYDHFTTSGFAAGGDDDNAIYGEIHGGASPEEMIVPVIVFDSKIQFPLTAKWDKETVKLKKGSINAKLHFNRKVKSLQVKIGRVDAICTTDNGTDWSLIIQDIAAGSYKPIIVADGHLIDFDKPLTIKPPLSGGEGDLP